MPKHQKKKDKKKKDEPVVEEDPSKRPPQTFVFKIGNVGRSVKELRDNLRLVMEPHTAVKLKERPSNSLKDFLSVAGPLGVSHFLIFSSTDFGTYMRAVKLPRGPTLTFRVHSYATISDITASLRRPESAGVRYKTSPLVVLNNFPSNEEHTKLMSIVFQNLFPPLNVQSVRITDCRRVVLFSYNKETKRIDFRHYAIKVSQVGISKNVKRLIKAKIPNLNNVDDISDYILGTYDGGSDSEAEDGPDNRISLPGSAIGKRTTAVQQTAVRMVEMGPRMELQLIKIEDDFCAGKVLFHEYVKKTTEEIELLNQRKEAEKRMKEQRRKQQEANVKKKKGIDSDDEDDENADSQDDEEEEDEDADWYRREVGEEPSRDLDLNDSKRKKQGNNKKEKYNPLYKKKPKKSADDEDDADAEDNREMARQKKPSFKRKDSFSNKKKVQFNNKKPKKG